MKSYSVTDVGQKRQVNQDYIFSSEEPVGNLPNLFVVADGMGGHKAGDFASSYAVQILLHSILEDKNQNPIIIIRQQSIEVSRSENQLLQDKLDFIPGVNASLGHNFNWGRSVDLQNLEIIRNSARGPWSTCGSWGTAFS